MWFLGADHGSSSVFNIFFYTKIEMVGVSVLGLTDELDQHFPYCILWNTIAFLRAFREINLFKYVWKKAILFVLVGDSC